MFMLVMQFFWKYIDDLMGKGIELSVILELLFYASAGLIPLSLPLAILLSSVMTFGNLSENNELTALKSSGLSLYKIIRPLFMLVVCIALFTFYFANYVIPVANLKWHTLIYDIQNTKISAVITPGVYNHQFEGYAIKVEDGENNEFEGVLIHDHTVNGEIKTIRAEHGKLYKSKDGKHLFFELKNGFISEELEPATPQKLPNGKIHRPKGNHPARKTDFDYATYKISLSGFDLQKTENEELLANKYEMLNVFQIKEATDSIQRKGQKFLTSFNLNLRSAHPYFSAKNFINQDKVKQDLRDLEVELEKAPEHTVKFDSLPFRQKIDAINKAKTKIRTITNNLDGQIKFLDASERDMDKYMVEFNRKFALTASILILFFIGAPLGAIVGRGGFGAPVIIAALLFMLYYVLISIGNNLAETGSVTPWFGMWFSAMILAPIAFFVMRAAALDIPINSGDYWSKRFRKKSKK